MRFSSVGGVAFGALGALLVGSMWTGCEDETTAPAACPDGFSECSGACVDLRRDEQNCGACGAVCEAGELCDGGGQCALSCQAGLTDCDGSCVDTGVDQANCGECGSACDPGQLCDGSGTCALTCQAGLLECEGGCIDPAVDRGFCGASGDCQAANAGVACAAGEICDGSGVCALSCQSGLAECNGTCVDTQSNPAHCGTCNNGCGDGACHEGDCRPVAEGTLFFSQDSNANGLYRFDVETGEPTLVGASGVTGWTVGLAWDPDKGILLGSKWSTLIYIQPNGLGVTDHGGVGTEALEYDSSTGTLYGGINGAFFTLDPNTGALIATLASPGFDAEGLAIDESQGILYAIGDDTSLHAYDVLGGTWSVVGDMGVNLNNGGLAYDPYREVLYGSGGTSLYRIDPDTAQATLIADTGMFMTGGLAFAPLYLF